MDALRYRIREFRDEDYPAEARLSNRVDPDDPTTPEELRHWDESTAAPHLVHRKFVTEERETGAVVATGAIHQIPFNYHPHKFWTSVHVDPDHRRRHLGQTMYALLEREASERAAIALWASVLLGDTAGRGFLERQGFVEQRRLWVSRLDLARVDLPSVPDRTPELAAEGIRFSTLAKEGPDNADVHRRLYRLWDACGQDVPIVGQHTSVPFETFVRLELGRPEVLTDATFLAIQGDEYVGMSSHEVHGLERSTLRIGFTGVLRTFRGHGIATELKRRAIEYARAQGYRFLRTGNDSLNAPIWAINQRLGFERLRTWIQAEKSLA
jgi:mycothiol synthase